MVWAALQPVNIAMLREKVGTMTSENVSLHPSQ
jgi:hypothetical protein